MYIKMKVYVLMDNIYSFKSTKGRICFYKNSLQRHNKLKSIVSLESTGRKLLSCFLLLLWLLFLFFFFLFLSF